MKNILAALMEGATRKVISYRPSHVRLYSRVILADALPGAFCPGVTFRLYSILATVKDLSASQETLDPIAGTALMVRSTERRPCPCVLGLVNLTRMAFTSFY